MVSCQLTINNRSGLHARPASQFVQAASKFQSSITVKYGERTANAKSMLNILALGITAGSTFELLADGPDENEALDALKALINDLAAAD